MTNQEKDLKNAREYLDETGQNLPFYVCEGSYSGDTFEIDKMLSEYVQWLEQKGVIKFTGKRL